MAPVTLHLVTEDLPRDCRERYRNFSPALTLDAPETQPRRDVADEASCGLGSTGPDLIRRQRCSQEEVCS